MLINCRFQTPEAEGQKALMVSRTISEYLAHFKVEKWKKGRGRDQGMFSHMKVAECHGLALLKQDSHAASFPFFMFTCLLSIIPSSEVLDLYL